MNDETETKAWTDREPIIRANNAVPLFPATNPVNEEVRVHMNWKIVLVGHELQQFSEGSRYLLIRFTARPLSRDHIPDGFPVGQRKQLVNTRYERRPISFDLHGSTTPQKTGT